MIDMPTKNMVHLTIDGKPAAVPEGTLIVNAAKSIGIDIPVFCYHPKMEPVGMCRQCLVEIGRPAVDRATGKPVLEADGSPKIQFGAKLEISCATPVSEGMVVKGVSPQATRGRKDILEFLLTSHPLDCPICDKGGECPLQNLTMRHGPGTSRFIWEEKCHLAKALPLGDLIYLDRERCIQCGRCVRFQDKIADDPVLAFHNRGRSMEIFSVSEPGFDSRFSGNTTDICPVGALTTSDFRFGARPWELCATASICQQCPVGCNIIINHRREARTDGEVVIKRIMPRQNEAVNEIWICDKGRFGYHYSESKERLTQPLVRRDGELVSIGWNEVLSYVAENLKDAGGNLLALAGGRLSNEDLFNLSELAHDVGGKTALYTHMAGGDLVAQLGVAPGTNLSNLGPGSAILVVACDLLEEAPVWWLRVKQAAERGATLIVANPRYTKLERYTRQVIRYPYGSEATAVLALLNAMSAKQSFPKAPKLPGAAQAVSAAAEAITKAENLVVFFGSEGIGLEASQALAQACASLLIATNHVHKVNNGLIGVWPRPNDQGAWELGYRPLPDLATAFQQHKAVYVAAADPVGDNPALAETVRQAGFVVVQDLFLTETAKLADVVLPAQPFTGREGTLTSGERRVQRYYPGVLNSKFKPDYAITAEIGKRMGIDLDIIPTRIFTRLAAKVAAFKGLNYRLLAQVTETEVTSLRENVYYREGVYYEGTMFGNAQGVGAQLALPTQVTPLTWPEIRETSPVHDALLAVPVNLLYDRGQTISQSLLLHYHLPPAYLSLNPKDVERLGLASGAQVQIPLDGASYTARLNVNEQVPPGIALVPRSLGIPIQAAMLIEINSAGVNKEGS